MEKILDIPKWPIADEQEEKDLKKVLKSANWW